jgi:WbqC-like protein family
MIIAVHQPQYLPWLGYFDKIDRSDVFVFLDNVQFKKNEWQNRNKIKTADGWQWLTVPVMYRFPQMINEVEINNKERWQHKQRQTIVSNYKRASCWNFLEVFFEDLFQSHWQTISQLNIYVVKKLVEILGIKTPLFIASEMEQLPEDPDERLIAITKYYGADTYLAGSGGRDYMNMEKYEENGIKVVFQDYRHPVYNQLFGDFLPFMSVIDLMYNHGNESLTILRGNT